MSGSSKEKLHDLGEILFRQVHPTFYSSGRISSQAFEAPRSHNGLLSVDRESLTTAQESYELYTEGFGRSSACVCGVTFGEVASEDLIAVPDSIGETDDHPANPAHAVIDLSELSRNRMKKIAGRLAKTARARGVLYEP